MRLCRFARMRPLTVCGRHGSIADDSLARNLFTDHTFPDDPVAHHTFVGRIPIAVVTFDIITLFIALRITTGGMTASGRAASATDAVAARVALAGISVAVAPVTFAAATAAS